MPVIQNQSGKKGFLSLIREAFTNHDIDLTKLSIRKSVVILAIPMMLEMMMESVFALVDLYFVGHLPDSSYAIQVVGLTESVLAIVYAIAVGMSMAATAVVARRIGEKKYEDAGRSGAQAILLATAITLILAVAGVMYAKEILLLMGASETVAEYGKPFTQIMMGSSVSIMLLFLINGVFRGAGNAAIAMKSLWLANICNIIFCPLFINGWGPVPAMGLTGAAIATTAGRTIGVIYQLYFLFDGKKLFYVTLGYFTPVKKMLTALLRIAAPGVFQFVIASGSWIVLARLVALTGGDHGSAGYQTALRLMMFFMLPAWGLSNAASTLVGQHLGAKQVEKATASVMKTIQLNVLFMLVVSILFFALGDWLVGFFTDDTAVVGVAKNAMHILAAGFVVYGVGMVLVNAFNGAGDTRTPTWINFFGFWLFQIPLAYILSIVLEWGPTGVFFSIPTAELLITVTAFILFKKGKWKTTQV